MEDGLPPMLLVAGVIELAAGVLVTLGLFTRWAALLASGEMAVAYWMAHFPSSFWPALNQGELAIMFCFVFLYLVFAGPGAWAVDNAMGGRGRAAGVA
jgi:putative oxidoreductase